MGTVAAVFSVKKLLELMEMLAQFENTFPDFAGRWKVIGMEAREVCFIHMDKRDDAYSHLG